MSLVLTRLDNRVMQRWLASRRTCTASSSSRAECFHARHTSPRRSPDCTGYSAAEHIHQIQVGNIDIPTLSALCSPRYLSTQLTNVADISVSSAPSLIRRQRSPCSSDARLVTVDDLAFPITAAKLWNELAGGVSASLSMTAFRYLLKTFCFVCLLGFIICTARCFAIAVFALTLTLTLYIVSRWQSLAT